MTAIPHPDFNAPRFATAPDARFVPAPADGVLPEDFFSTTNLPTYVRIGGDVAAAARAAHGLGARARQRRRALGPRRAPRQARATWSPSARRRTAARASTCTPQRVPGEARATASSSSWRARSRARSRSTTRTWRSILIEERERGGYPIWVTGPALVHSRARADMVVVHRRTASSARCSPATPSPCTTSRRRSSARRSA